MVASGRIGSRSIMCLGPDFLCANSCSRFNRNDRVCSVGFAVAIPGIVGVAGRDVDAAAGFRKLCKVNGVAGDVDAAAGFRKLCKKLDRPSTTATLGSAFAWGGVCGCCWCEMAGVDDGSSGFVALLRC